MKLEVHQALKEDVYRDIARIPEASRVDKRGRDIPEGEIRRMIVGNKSAFVAVRGDLGATKPTVRLDEKTREALGLQYSQTVDVQFDSPIFRNWRWAWSAAEIGYRVASRIAVVSLFLGLVGLALGIIALLN